MTLPSVKSVAECIYARYNHERWFISSTVERDAGGVVAVRLLTSGECPFQTHRPVQGREVRVGVLVGKELIEQTNLKRERDRYMEHQDALLKRRKLKIDADRERAKRVAARVAELSAANARNAKDVA